MQGLNSMSQGTELSTKDQGFNGGLLLGKPVNHTVVEKDDKSSSGALAHHVTYVIAIHEHP